MKKSLAAVHRIFNSFYFKSAILGILIFTIQPMVWGDLETYFKKESKEKAVVEQVLQADLLLLDNGKRIQLIGADAPYFDRKKRYPLDEKGQLVVNSDPETSWEEQGYVWVLSTCEGKSVSIEYDVQRMDENGDVLGYVFLSDGKLLNAEILRQGFADLKIRPPNLKFADQLRAAYREARQEKRGLQGE